MIYSMTGFSRKRIKSDYGVFIWEIRSLNQRFLEISIHLLDQFRTLEPIIKRYIQSQVNRGKVECNLILEQNNLNYQNININTKLIKNLIQIIESLKIQNITKNVNLIDILNWPGILIHNKKNFQKITTKLLISSLKLTIKELILTRKNEGLVLNNIIINKLSLIEKEINKIFSYLPDSLKLERKKLLFKFKQLKINLDPHRFEQELLIIVQKMDISEELDRIQNHIKEIYSTLKQSNSIGRKLEFILQELTRETNTLISKSITSNITMTAIEIKILIEQIREQAQNIE